MQIDKLYHFTGFYVGQRIMTKGMKPRTPLFTVCLENNESMFELPDEVPLYKLLINPFRVIPYRGDILRGLRLPKYAHHFYSFCLSEPSLKNWLESKEFSRLPRKHTCIEVTLAPDDEIYVVDWTLMTPQPKPAKEFGKDQLEYVKSRIKLEEHVDGSFYLPEFLIRSSIPRNRMRELDYIIEYKELLKKAKCDGSQEQAQSESLSSQPRNIEQPGYISFQKYSKLAQLSHGFESKGRGEGPWGKGAAGLLIVTKDLQDVLLFRRSKHVDEPYLWGIPGGARKQTADGLEEAIITATSESKEEMDDIPRGRIRVKPYVYQKPGTEFTYATFILEIDPLDRQSFTPKLNWEHTDHRWFRRDSLNGVQLHPGVKDMLDNYQFEASSGK